MLSKTIIGIYIGAFLCIPVAHAARWQAPVSAQSAGIYGFSAQADGHLSEWSIGWLVGNSPSATDRPYFDWLPQASGASYWIQDSAGAKERRQGMDMEAGYLAWSNPSLNLAVVTGATSRRGKLGPYVARSGDIFFDVTGDDQWDFALATRTRGKVVQIQAGHVYGPGKSRWWRDADGGAASAPVRIRNRRVEEWFAVPFTYADGAATELGAGHNVIECAIPVEQLAEYLSIGETVTMVLAQEKGKEVMRLTAVAPMQGTGAPGTLPYEVSNNEVSMPEPATLLLMGLGGLGIALRRRLRRG